MSDCLTCGVLPYGPDVDPQFKRDNTIYVRPFLEGLNPAVSSSGSERWIGTPVRAFPDLTLDTLTTNPRDLSWDEFEKCEILLGTVREAFKYAKNLDMEINDDLVAYDGTVDFGAKRGVMKSRIWLRAQTGLNHDGFLEKLRGRQVLAATNLDNEGDGQLYEEEMAAILTMNGHTTMEPAKVAENGYRLA